MDFFQEVRKIYNKLKNTGGGKNADYISALEKVNPNLYSITICTVDGQYFNIGDFKHEFAIESCSKVFTLALALEKYGKSVLKDKIGEYTSKENFNSICAVDKISNHTINSFNNGGAMATTSLLYNPNKQKFIKVIVDNMSDFADKKLHINNKIYTSEILHSEHNLAIAYLLKSYNRFYGEVESSVDVYTKQCSVMVTTKDIALMAATLANGGINPETKKQLISKSNADYIINHMSINGLYNETSKWMHDVGFPAKSGVSGLLLIVVPGVMGIGIASPPLNKYGNSVKGIKTAKLISKYLDK
jgi:glutaminase